MDNYFCACGLPKSQCKKVHKPKKAKRGKYSGLSKRPYGKYEET